MLQLLPKKEREKKPDIRGTTEAAGIDQYTPPTRGRLKLPGNIKGNRI